jgi:hypothetical protein
VIPGPAQIQGKLDKGIVPIRFDERRIIALGYRFHCSARHDFCWITGSNSAGGMFQNESGGVTLIVVLLFLGRQRCVGNQRSEARRPSAALKIVFQRKGARFIRSIFFTVRQIPTRNPNGEHLGQPHPPRAKPVSFKFNVRAGDMSPSQM